MIPYSGSLAATRVRGSSTPRPSAWPYRHDQARRACAEPRAAASCRHPAQLLAGRKRGRPVDPCGLRHAVHRFAREISPLARHRPKELAATWRRASAAFESLVKGQIEINAATLATPLVEASLTSSVMRKRAPFALIVSLVRRSAAQSQRRGRLPTGRSSRMNSRRGSTWSPSRW